MSRRPIQPKLSVYSFIGENDDLFDRRLESCGVYFGTVGQVAKQYGVKIKKCGKYNQFEAPQMRLQLFIEKLHFAGVKYFEKQPL